MFVALGSALGGVARYALASVFPLLPGRWPVATMVVNLAGSLLIGILSVALGVRGGGPDTVRLFWLTLMVGTGASLRAIGYVLVTVFGCLAAAMAGRAIGALLAGET
jgi:CrcB protein